MCVRVSSVSKDFNATESLRFINRIIIIIAHWYFILRGLKINMIIIILCPREYKARGLKQEAKYKISTAARGIIFF